MKYKINPQYETPELKFLGYAQNQDSSTPGKTALALMISFLYAKTCVCCTYVFVRNMEHQYLLECLSLLHCEIIHNCVDFVSVVLTDNLSVNQKAFKSFHAKYTSNSICWIKRPINTSLFVIYNVTHLMKNIRNYWITEKTKTLEFVVPFTNKNTVVKWSDIFKIYKLDENNIIKIHS